MRDTYITVQYAYIIHVNISTSRFHEVRSDLYGSSRNVRSGKAEAESIYAVIDILAEECSIVHHRIGLSTIYLLYLLYIQCWTRYDYDIPITRYIDITHSILDRRSIQSIHQSIIEYVHQITVCPMFFSTLSSPTLRDIFLSSHPL